MHNVLTQFKSTFTSTESIDFIFHEAVKRKWYINHSKADDLVDPHLTLNINFQLGNYVRGGGGGGKGRVMES